MNVFVFIFCVFIGWGVVGFGMAAWSPVLSLLASLAGYAVFLRALVEIPYKKRRFLLASGWYFSVQLVQLSWFISHPFLYIYAVYLALAAAKGIQFGLVFMFLTKERADKVSCLCGFAGAWVLMEWLRLFFMVGYSFNPAGLAMAANLYTLQLASAAGVFGLSFIVILTNLLLLRFLLRKNYFSALAWGLMAVFPFLLGFGHIRYHSTEGAEEIKVLLAQTNFPAEENLSFQSPQEIIQYVQEEWYQILSLLGQYAGEPVDLIVLPELVVPYEAYLPLFRLDAVDAAIDTFLGKNPPRRPDRHTMVKVDTPSGPVSLVNHAYMCQTISDIFNAPLVVGLEDSDTPDGQNEKLYYSSAFVFYPHTSGVFRYDKRVLVPMGEYIPFAWLRKLARKYGVAGSFTPGSCAKVFSTPKARIGVSICYEETFGNLMRANKLQGAELLVNLTNDGWYPRSTLPMQHLEHARLRTVEMGIPLIRSCNTGVTCAVDSLGRNIALLADEQGKTDDLADVLYTALPKYTYLTLYSRTGDAPVVGASLFFLCAALALSRRQK